MPLHHDDLHFDLQHSGIGFMLSTGGTALVAMPNSSLLRLAKVRREIRRHSRQGTEKPETHAGLRSACQKSTF